MHALTHACTHTYTNRRAAFASGETSDLTQEEQEDASQPRKKKRVISKAFISSSEESSGDEKQATVARDKEEEEEEGEGKEDAGIAKASPENELTEGTEETVSSSASSSSESDRYGFALSTLKVYQTVFFTGIGACKLTFVRV